MKLSFYFHPKNKDESRIVNTVRIDQCIDRIDMIKIDVEGWEYQVLKGIESFLVPNDNPIHIFQEYCPSLLKQNLQTWGNMMEFMDHYAHKITIINEKTKQLQFITIEQLNSLKERTNLLWWSG